MNPEIRRILIALDASAGSLAALEGAAQLAARLHAELLGLFVEDQNLIHLARHPEARHFNLPSLTGAPIEDAAIEDQLRAVAERAQAAFRTAARRAQVSASFRIARGFVVDEVLAAAREADLLILGLAGRALATTGRLGRTAGAAAAATAGPVLLLPPGATLAEPPLLFLEPCPGAQAVVEAAHRLAESGGSLRLLVAGATQDEAAELAARAAEWLAERGHPAHATLFAAADRLRLRGALRRESRGVLIVAADSPCLREAGLRTFLDDVARPTLLAR